MVARCLCKWLAKLPRYGHLRNFARVQETKLRLFHLCLVALAPAIQFLLRSRHNIRRSCYFYRGIFFKLARPRLEDANNSEVMLIPGRSMLGIALLRDVHERNHDVTVGTARMQIDGLFHFLPDTVTEILTQMKEECVKCRKYPRVQKKGNKPVPMLPDLGVLSTYISISVCNDRSNCTGRVSCLLFLLLEKKKTKTPPWST